MQATLAPIPAHVPEHLVYDFDPTNDPLLHRDPHISATALHRIAPRLFYTRHNGGQWVVTHAADALEILRDPERFSSDPKNNWFNAQRKPRTVPNQYDPPEHTSFRKILNPMFSPGAMARIADDVRAMAVELIEEVLPKGGCEFISEIGQRFPVYIFLKLVDTPRELAPDLLARVEKFVRGVDGATKLQGLAEVGAYIVTALEERRRKPGTDLLSKLLEAKVDGERPLTQGELEGAGTLLFLGGLDTVTSTLSFIMNYLGQHPEQYARLVNDPGLIGSGVEELLRVHGGANFERAATQDIDFNGVKIAKGDRLNFISQVYGLDPEIIENPFEINLDREISPHLIFGAGPHRCLGSHLARIEIRIFLEEWTRRITQFRVEGDVPTKGGIVWSPEYLNLRWNAPG